MRYRREILVPYLKNVYMAELVREGYVSKITQNEEVIGNNQMAIRWAEQDIESGIDADAQSREEFLCREKLNGRPYFMILCILLVIISPYFIFFSPNLFMFLCVIIGAAVSFVLHFVRIIISMQGIKRQVKKESLQKKEKRAQDIDSYRNNIEICRKNIERLKTALNPIENNRQGVYSANIIPINYRNIYCAKYLYDYFRTSLEDDLDSVIQTFLLNHITLQLEEIKGLLVDIVSELQAISAEIAGMNCKLDAIQNTSIETQQSVARMVENTSGFADRTVLVRMIGCSSQNDYFFANNRLY